MKKLKLLSLTLAASILMGLISGCAASKTEEAKVETYKRTEVITSSEEALKLLKEGNERFVGDKTDDKDLGTERKSALVTNGQHPFAVVVSCSDSRVPTEVVFDQALGDIFIVRDAGNVVDALELGSVEYGAEHLASPLIVVMGHEKCGAVKATVDGGEPEGSIGSIVEKIKPSLEKVQKENAGAEKSVLYTKTEDENIENSINAIKSSEVIKKLEEEGKVKVVGAKYHIETGEVVFTEE